MNEEKKINEEMNNSTKSVDKKRRAIAKAGIATPVIMTLVSRPVFGVPCLSEVMSGNLSAPGNSCSLGNSPGGWGQPGGQTRDGVHFTSYSGFSSGAHAYKWPTGHTYGYLSQDADSEATTNPRQGGTGNQCSDYYGGTSYSTVFGYEPLEAPDKPMRQILCEDKTSVDRHLVAAMLNAHHYDNYVLTVQQVKDLRKNPDSYPTSFGSLKDFLDSTW